MKLYWLDIETTGLVPQQDKILEVGVMTADLERPFEADVLYHAVLNCTPAVATRLCGPFVRNMHTKNGLLVECADSGLYLRDVDRDLGDLIEGGPRDSILAGSSIHFDRDFLREHLPAIAERFSHRLYDVSAVKLFCRSLGMPPLPDGEGAAHRVLDDIRSSIDHARRCMQWLESRES